MYPKPENPTRLVHLKFKPLWLYVDHVREFCSFFARTSFESEHLGQRMSVVVHELVENAIRYGGDDEELELLIERCDKLVVVKVANTASAERAEVLQRVFADTLELPAEASYLRALRRAAAQPTAQSGLGLPRVRHEGAVDLELELLPGRVCITARGAA